MSQDINTYYHYDQEKEVSKDRVKFLFNLISKVGWGYDSNDIRGVYTEKTDWNFDVQFEEALEIISGQSFVGMSLGDGDIEGHVSFTEDYTKIYFDSVHFRDSEDFGRDGNENSRKIIELLEHLTKKLDFEWMRGDKEHEINPHKENFDLRNTLLWINYIPKVSIEDLDLSEAYKAKEINEGLFIVTRLNPYREPDNIEEIEDMKEKITANIQND